MTVVDKVRQLVDRHRMLAPGDTVVVGVSGGPDSLCLLHVLRELQAEYGIALHVAHLNHQIRGQEAEADAAFVAQVAQAWGLPATIGARDVPRLARERRLAIEEAARCARYGFLAEVAHRVGAKTIAVGHHADDQVETVLMHFLRGSGLAGLRGMLPVMPLADYRLIEPGNERGQACAEAKRSSGPSTQPDLYLIRPLLEVSRAEIEGYCREHGLEPRFDLSNLDQTYYRNRLRHELIPLLESYNPAVRHIVRRSARVIADDYAYLHQQTLDAWTQVVSAEAGESIVFDLARWRALPTSLKRGTLREAIHRLRRSLRNVNWVHVEDALRALESKTTSTQVTLPQGLMLTIGYISFTVANEGYVPPTDLPALAVDSLPLVVPGVTTLPESHWRVEAEVSSRDELPAGWEQNQDPWQVYLDYERTGAELVLRCRRPGDRFQPLGMGSHEKLLREFMINAKIPQSARDRLPLVVSPRHIVWVPGWQPDERVKISQGTKVILHLRFASPPGPLS